jgi:hypothetical protein
MDAQVFCRFKVLGRDRFDICGEIAISQVGVGARIDAYYHQFAPIPVAVAGLFEQFPLGGDEWGSVFFFADTGAKFVGRDTQAMTVLSYKYEFLLFGDCDHVDPFRILVNIIFGNFVPVRQFHFFPAYGKPRLAGQVFTFQHFPTFVFRCFHSIVILLLLNSHSL